MHPSPSSEPAGDASGPTLIGRLQSAVKDDAPSDAPALELVGVSKRFGAVVACEDVNLEVGPGEVVALAGHNGAGKSTVLKMLAGVIQPDMGELRLRGQAVHLRSVRAARAHGIETVPQELALAPKLSIPANIFLGRELLLRPSFLRLRARRQMEVEATKVLESLGVRIPRIRAAAGSLSGGQAQAVAIARAVGWGRSVVVLDEPTAALGLHETAQVEQTVLRMKEMGLAILIVSHDLDQMFRLADRIYVLYHGRVVGVESTDDATPEKIGTLIHGHQPEAAAL
ncbi:MAG TPA: ATP-binding cassette domain-containing protein [Solirubrobacteraceae bacterium]|jgi:simple sugar transport system ATP-binding protein|nr:ATP-binding cassette domain-containing protein [Solirubrobacteraceae bacterium]